MEGGVISTTSPEKYITAFMHKRVVNKKHKLCPYVCLTHLQDINIFVQKTRGKWRLKTLNISHCHKHAKHSHDNKKQGNHSRNMVF